MGVIKANNGVILIMLIIAINRLVFRLRLFNKVLRYPFGNIDNGEFNVFNYRSDFLCDFSFIFLAYFGSYKRKLFLVDYQPFFSDRPSIEFRLFCSLMKIVPYIVIARGNYTVDT